MIFNIQHTANWEYIRARKQRLIQKNNKNESKSRVPHTYHVNDEVMLRKGTENKYEAPFSGPQHKILKVNTNGSVCLHVGSVNDMVNIRRIEPYKEVSGSILWLLNRYFQNSISFPSCNYFLRYSNSKLSAVTRMPSYNYLPGMLFCRSCKKF
jgi:hypothetical protein